MPSPTTKGISNFIHVCVKLFQHKTQQESLGKHGGYGADGHMPLEE